MQVSNATLWGAATVACTILCAAPPGGAASLQTLDFIPHAVSADGTIVVGAGTAGPVRWTASGGTVSRLEGRYGGWANDVSADGSVIVGITSASSSAYAPRPFRWTASAGMAELGSLPNRIDSEARAVSADGSVVVGNGVPYSFTDNVPLDRLDRHGRPFSRHFRG